MEKLGRENERVPLAASVCVAGMARSLSQRTLALIVPPVQELLVILVGIWAQMLLVLLASGAHRVSASDSNAGESAADEYLDAEEELAHSVDSR